MKKAVFILGLLSTHWLMAQCPFDPLINESGSIICPGTTTTLSTQTYDSYQWYQSFSSSSIGSPIPGETNQTLTVNDFGYYTVEATLGGCTEFSNTVLIDMYAFLNPAIISSGQSTYCDGDSTLIELIMGGWTNVQWSKDFNPIPGANSTSYWVTESGTYTVSASPIDCPGTTLFAGIGPTFTFLVPSVPIINWDFINLTSSSAVTYQWNLSGTPIPGATNQTYTPLVSGNYTVTTTDANGCEATSDITNVVLCTYAPTIVQPDTLICPNDILTINTQLYDSYQWFMSSTSNSVGNALLGANGPDLDIAAPGFYTVQTTLGGCTTYSNQISVDTLSFTSPTVSASGQTTICQGDSTFIEVTPGSWSSTEWFIDGTPLPISGATSFWAFDPGTYSVITYPIECPSIQLNGSSTITISVNTPQTPTISWDGTNLTSSVANFYQWNLDALPISGATNQSHTPLSNGAYSVTTTDINNCSATSDTIMINLSSDKIEELTEKIKIINGNGYIQVILQDQIESITLLDLNGRIISEQSGYQTVINTSNQPSGSYVLIVSTDTNIYRRKVLIP